MMTTTSILSLNDDILSLLIEAVPDIHTLKALSRTCWRIRDQCLHALFGRAIICNYHGPISRRNLLPRRLWTYVRTLRLYDFCDDSGRWAPYARLPPQDRLRRGSEVWRPTTLCEPYSGPFLSKMLKRMPQLRVVSFTLEAMSAHGLPWSLVRTVLSIPDLRELFVHFHHIAPILEPEEELTLGSCPPLTTFYFSLPDARATAHTSPTERQVLALILRFTSRSLQHLTLPSDEAPIQEMFTTLEWPCLRSLHLRGEPLSIGDPPAPYVSIFTRMPQLQRLELELGQPVDVDPRPFWPRGFVAEWPLPELRHLTLSCPQVGDQVYAALSPSLRSLTLRYAPHYITNEMSEVDGFVREDRVWQWPMLGSAEMLEVLCLCRLPALEHLEIEYWADDDADEELLSYLGDAFPHLKSLVVLRYRSPNEATVPLGRIASAITSLTYLQTLTLHADLPETPVRVEIPGYKDRTTYGYECEDLEAFNTTAQSVADAIARASPASLENIKLWAPCGDLQRAAYLALFKVVRDHGVAARARAERLKGDYKRVWLSRPSMHYNRIYRPMD